MLQEMTEPRFLLFDLGGVLVEVSGTSALQRLLPQLDAAQIQARWQASPAVGRFESGAIGADEFAAQFVDEWKLPLEPPHFLQNFAAWVSGFYPGARELLAGLRRTHTVACLSNTNATHWARLAEAEALFDVCIASHLTGHMKPGARAFAHAAQVLGAPAESICFFDDLSANVEAARSLGMRAFQVRGLDETMAALRSCGIAPVTTENPGQGIPSCPRTE
jgi:putative hydrolase of the HAD superfamily